MDIFFTSDAFEETDISNFVIENLDKVSKSMMEKNYGNDVVTILIVFCCFKIYPISFPRIKYLKNNKELRLDILLDYNKSIQMKDIGKTHLYIFESLEKELKHLVKSLPIKDFNVEGFLDDFQGLTI